MTVGASLRVILPREVDLEDRLMAADGTCLAMEIPADTGEIPFIPQALVPRPGWRRPSADECTLLRSVAEDPAHCLWIVPAPSGPIDALRKSGLAEALGQAQAASLVTSSEVSVQLDELAAFASTLAVDPDELQKLGVSVRAPGLTTTTVDVRKNRRIGLHVDSWDQAEWRERRRSRNRINFNLGRGDRFLLVAPVGIDDIYAAKGKCLEGPGELAPSALARAYLQRHRALPVWRVRIVPGEAYIASTELFPHDSTTVMKTEPDVSFTLLGHFAGDIALGRSSRGKDRR
jgi:hypothetical protein